MKVADIIAAWKSFVVKMNDKGVPMPMARYKGQGNPALTLVIISSVLVIVGIVGKWSGKLGGIDMVNAMQFFYASCTLFFGHSWVHKDADGSSDVVEGGDGQK